MVFVFTSDFQLGVDVQLRRRRTLHYSNHHRRQSRQVPGRNPMVWYSPRQGTVIGDGLALRCLLASHVHRVASHRIASRVQPDSSLVHVQVQGSEAPAPSCHWVQHIVFELQISVGIGRHSTGQRNGRDMGKRIEGIIVQSKSIEQGWTTSSIYNIFSCAIKTKV